jgi:hypothetical protein
MVLENLVSEFDLRAMQPVPTELSRPFTKVGEDMRERCP